MKKLLLAIPLSLLSMMSYSSNNIVLFYSGAAAVNTKPLPDIFRTACDCSTTGCTPTTTVLMRNAVTGEPVGDIYVWTKDGVASPDGKTFCFTELIQYNIGLFSSIYTIGNKNGTCGAQADPNLIPVPATGSDPVVVVGGGAGRIVGGTGLYRNVKGGEYIDRVFVGLDDLGNVKNYSGLYFTLSPKFRFPAS